MKIPFRNGTEINLPTKFCFISCGPGVKQGCDGERSQDNAESSAHTQGGVIQHLNFKSVCKVGGTNKRFHYEKVLFPPLYSSRKRKLLCCTVMPFATRKGRTSSCAVKWTRTQRHPVAVVNILYSYILFYVVHLPSSSRVEEQWKGAEKGAKS